MNLKISEFINDTDCVLLLASGFSTQVTKKSKNQVDDISRHSVFNLDAETIKT